VEISHLVLAFFGYIHYNKTTKRKYQQKSYRAEQKVPEDITVKRQRRTALFHDKANGFIMEQNDSCLAWMR